MAMTWVPALTIGVTMLGASAAWAQQGVATPGEQVQPDAAQMIAKAPELPPDYVIGPDDILGIVFWELANHGGEVVVRPDGKITLPLIDDVHAAGLTPEQLRDRIVAASQKFVRDPSVSVVVKQINSRKVYVTGQVRTPGTFPLTGPTTVLQMLALAGGVADFAKRDRIMVMRTEAGRTVSYRFNYKDVSQGKNLEQNILLKPGDTVVVP
jgi:polysaccharide biosynthesis/export protein